MGVKKGDHPTVQQIGEDDPRLAVIELGEPDLAGLSMKATNEWDRPFMLPP
jgi:hypothetical protein